MYFKNLEFKGNSNCFCQNLDFLGVLGYQIYKSNGNLINLGVLIRKGGRRQRSENVKVESFKYYCKHVEVESFNALPFCNDRI